MRSAEPVTADRRPAGRSVPPTSWLIGALAMAAVLIVLLLGGGLFGDRITATNSAGTKSNITGSTVTIQGGPGGGTP
jgi:hypothetical protein